MERAERGARSIGRTADDCTVPSATVLTSHLICGQSRRSGRCSQGPEHVSPHCEIVPAWGLLSRLVHHVDDSHDAVHLSAGAVDVELRERPSTQTSTNRKASSPHLAHHDVFVRIRELQGHQGRAHILRHLRQRRRQTS